MSLGCDGCRSSGLTGLGHAIGAQSGVSRTGFIAVRETPHGTRRSLALSGFVSSRSAVPVVVGGIEARGALFLIIPAKNPNSI